MWNGLMFLSEWLYHNARYQYPDWHNQECTDLLHVYAFFLRKGPVQMRKGSLHTLCCHEWSPVSSHLNVICFWISFLTWLEYICIIQAMYDAIQKLDKKFDSLHRKVSEMQHKRLKPLFLKPVSIKCYNHG